MGFCHVGQAGLELLASNDPPASASQSAEITGMSHCAWPQELFLEQNNSNQEDYISQTPLQHSVAICYKYFLSSRLGDSQWRSPTGRQRNSCGRHGSFAGASAWRFSVQSKRN
ncbi:hypothetical protein AAY473_001438 [Plecturocebus cupreus]